MNLDENPCLACTLEKNCCQKLTGIKLTREEYERLFETFSDGFEITDHGEWLELFAKDDVNCPHWDGQCTIHNERPVECALYPHTISEVHKKKNRVTVAYHSRTSCPLKATLQSSEEEAAALVHQFAEQAYGKDCDITVISEKGFGIVTAMPLKLTRKLKQKVA